MIAHVVLFTPKPAISDNERLAFIHALETALRDIPQIVRSTVGRRFIAGRAYDALATAAYDYLAIMEFRSREDLAHYLDHPAHLALAEQFYGQMQVALAYDYEVVDGAEARTLVEHP
jgi:Stress responsive A/B Barrel Domain